jgi:hypothetical protein
VPVGSTSSLSEHGEKIRVRSLGTTSRSACQAKAYMKIRRCLTIDTAEFTPEEAAQEIILHLEREGFIGLNEEAA